jgi:hypothetical protein
VRVVHAGMPRARGHPSLILRTSEAPSDEAHHISSMIAPRHQDISLPLICSARVSFAVRGRPAGRARAGRLSQVSTRGRDWFSYADLREWRIVVSLISILYLRNAVPLTVADLQQRDLEHDVHAELGRELRADLRVLGAHLLCHTRVRQPVPSS